MMLDSMDAARGQIIEIPPLTCSCSLDNPALGKLHFTAGQPMPVSWWSAESLHCPRRKGRNLPPRRREIASGIQLTTRYRQRENRNAVHPRA